MPAQRDEVFFETRKTLHDWLAKYFEQPEGIWAVFYKKTSGLGDLSWEAIVEECLCFGWIDSLPGKVDEQITKIYISPRKSNSGWSRRNKLLLIELQRQGLIQEPGIKVIERAKSNGSWQRFDLAESLTIPTELKDSFKADPGFKQAWSALTDAKQRQYLQQIYDAKADATRAKRITTIRNSICP
jgi:uncharacterized protein YdeI (YjbR/CyaY-like superfamily)